MARPPSISNQQILDAARAEFLAHGLAKASTLDIAQRAGVSEGSIFNRFPTKDALFRAAMDEAQPPALALDGYVGKGDLRENLVRITVESVHYLNNFLPKLMLRWSERELGPKAKVCTRPREILRALTSFFAEEKALGRVSGDPPIIARMFMGSVWNYCFMLAVAGDRSMSVKTFAGRLVAGLWQGIESNEAREEGAMTTPRPPVNKWLVTLSVTFGTLMGTIDASIVNVALPHIRGSVGATLEEITWITTGFVVANVIVMPLTGFLSRMFGQKRVYLTSLIVFLLGSMLCGTAHSLTTLAIFRVLQGMGAGALQPTEQAILRRTFPPHEQGMAMAVFGMAVVLGPAIGPTLGGFIVDHYSWEWIFFINLPVGALGFLMVSAFVHEDEETLRANHAQAEREKKSVDWAGIAMMAVGLALVQYVLEEGTRDDWFESRTICACLAVGIISLIAFVVRELTATTPAVDLRLFKDKTFMSATLIGAVQFAILMANLFLLPVFMQEMLGYSAIDTGLALLPRAAIMFVVNPIVGKLYNKVSLRLLVGNGVVCVSLGSFAMATFTLQTSLSQIILATLVQGVGFSCLFIPLAAAALSNIPKPRLADAAGLNSLFRQLGGSIGLAIFATLLTRYGTVARASLAVHITELRPEVAGRLAQITAGLGARGLDPVSARSGAFKALNGLVFGQGMTLAFERTFYLAGIVFLTVLPLLYFLRITRKPSGPIHLE